MAVYETGSFALEAQRLASAAVNKNSNLYIAPTSSELQTFELLAEALWTGNVNQADKYATQLGYEVVEFTDSSSGAKLLGVREVSADGKAPRGWGSYFVNLNEKANALIEVPHVKADIATEKIGVESFLNTGAAGFLLSGAHRDANGFGTADVCDLANSIFHIVHSTWSRLRPSVVTWQVHGYAAANHNFPAGTDLIISNGDGSISDEVLSLDQEMHALGLLSYAYNTQAVSSDRNIAVNDGISGSTFSSLGGTTNIQGQQSRLVGSTFIHAEFEQSVRLDQAGLALAVAALTNAIKASNSAINLHFTEGVDRLTGTSLGDRFVMNRLTDSLMSSTPDRITNLQAGIDVIDTPFTRETAINPKFLGSVSALTNNAIGAVLSTKGAFSKRGASLFTYDDGMLSTRTFLAVNDNISRFNKATDSIIEITGFSGDLASLSIF